jgi:hypothetical protein
VSEGNGQRAFSLFDIAAIIHGIEGRVIRGTVSSAQAADRAKSFPLLALEWVCRSMDDCR